MKITPEQALDRSRVVGGWANDAGAALCAAGSPRTSIPKGLRTSAHMGTPIPHPQYLIPQYRILSAPPSQRPTLSATAQSARRRTRLGHVLIVAARLDRDLKVNARILELVVVRALGRYFTPHILRHSPCILLFLSWFRYSSP